MYSTAKRLAATSAIACAASILGLFLFVLCSASLRLSFATAFAIYTVLISSIACLLTLTLSMRSICQDLEYEYENNILKIKELTERIKQLESKENN